jgi:hypothetical protein
VTDVRRRHDDGLPSTGEVARRLDRHEARSEQLHRDMIRMIEKLDHRTDSIATRVSVIFAVVAVLWAVFLVVAPLIRVLFGVPNG